MRVRLVLLAVRTVLTFAILGCVIAGEPRVDTLVAMRIQQPTPTATPEGADAGPAAPTEQPVATPTPIHKPSDKPPTWIEAPAIDLSAPVVPANQRTVYLGDTMAIEWDVPYNAAGFHTGSALPGHPGNTVLSGHNNMGSEVFRRLIDLKIDDEVILYVDKTPYRYKITQKELVREAGVSQEERRKNGEWIAPTDDERLTLVTCWPYTGNSHRLIIVAKPVP